MFLLYNYSSVGLCSGFQGCALSYFHSSTVIFSLKWKWVQWPPDDTDFIQPSLYSKTQHTLFLVWHFFVLILRIQCKAHLFCLASGVCQATQPLKCRFDGRTEKVGSIYTLFTSGDRTLWFHLGRDSRIFQNKEMFLKNRSHFYFYVYSTSIGEVCNR